MSSLQISIWDLPSPKDFSLLLTDVRANKNGARERMMLNVRPLVGYIRQFGVGSLTLSDELLGQMYSGSNELDHYLERAALLCPVQMCSLLRSAVNAYSLPSNVEPAITIEKFDALLDHFSALIEELPSNGIEFMSIDVDISLTHIALSYLLQSMEEMATNSKL